MKNKILLGVGVVVGLVVLAVGGLVAAASQQPDVIHVERTLAMSAAPQDVRPQIEDFRNFVAWSPWSERDPNQTTTFSDPASGVGAWYTWNGNEDVGSGRMELTSIEPMKVVQQLEFKEPIEAKATVTYLLAERDGITEVTWAMDQPADLMTKTMTMFMDMDAMMGPDFEKGLAGMKVRAERVATERHAAELAAAELAAAEQAAAEQAAAEGLDGGEGEAAGGAN